SGHDDVRPAGHGVGRQGRRGRSPRPDHRRRPALPHRRRHRRDPAKHHRRARARPSEGAVVRLNPEPDQLELRSYVRSFLAKHCPISAVREAMDSDTGYDQALWTRLTRDLGVPAFAVSEAGGGADLGVTELALAMEECGAALVPGPLFGSGVLSALVL